MPRRRPRTIRRVIIGITAASSSLAPVMFTALDASSPAAASIGTDKAKAKALEAKITAQAARVQQLVTEYDSVPGHLQVLNAKIARDKIRLRHDIAAKQQA